MEQFVLEVPTSFPALVKFASHVKKISMPALSRKSGVSYPTVMNIAAGKNAKMENMEKVAKTLGIKMSYTLEA
jgi:lambda repressor-like predicted transcriptional regulator